MNDELTLDYDRVIKDYEDSPYPAMKHRHPHACMLSLYLKDHTDYWTEELGNDRFVKVLNQLRKQGRTYES